MKFNCCPAICRTGYVFSIVFCFGALAQAQPPVINWDSIHAAEAAANRHADERDAQSIKDEKRAREYDRVTGSTAESRQDREYLLRRRKNALHEIQVAERIIGARSYSAKIEAYCREEMGRPSSPMMAFSPNYMSGEELEILYQQLLREEPKTREGEQNRQHDLAVVRSFVSHYEENVDTCKGMILNWGQKMPSDNDEWNIIKQAKVDIAEVNQQLEAEYRRK